MHRSRSPRNRLDEAFSISSLSDCSVDNNGSSGFMNFSRNASNRRKQRPRNYKNNHSRGNRDGEYLHLEQNTYFQGSKEQIDLSVDPSVCDFQGAAIRRSPSLMSHNEATYIPTKRPIDRAEKSNERLRKDRRSLSERDRESRKHFNDRVDRGERRHTDERSDQRERRFTSNRTNSDKRTSSDHQNQGKNIPDDRINRLEKMVELLVHTKPQTSSFRPAKESNQASLEASLGLNFTTSLWLNKINKECLDRNFDDVACINFLQTKMTGLMRAWFKTLDPYEYSWPELKMLITNTFPDTLDFANTLHLLVNKIKTQDETVTQYYFTKMYLIESCKISGSNAVSCLIHGLNDPYLQKQAKECNFLSPEILYSQFLVKIPNYGLRQSRLEPEPTQELEFRERDSYYSRAREESKKSEKDAPKKKCFTCGKVGHIAEVCRHAPMCYKCRQKGHIAAKCPNT